MTDLEFVDFLFKKLFTETDSELIDLHDCSRLLIITFNPII